MSSWARLTRQRLQYSVGFGLTETLAQLVDVLPVKAWTPAYDADRRPRDGAWVAELTGLADLTGWPAGMRLIVRAEHPHPGAQLRLHRLRRVPAHQRSSPTPAAGSWPTSNYGTAAEPAAKTASATPKTLA